MMNAAIKLRLLYKGIFCFRCPGFIKSKYITALSINILSTSFVFN